MTLTSRERATLRAEAHHLTAAVHVGQHGLTPALVRSLDEALRTRELVKVQLTRSATVTAREAADALAASVGGEVVQVIGRTTTFYRENLALHESGDPRPPWRR